MNELDFFIAYSDAVEAEWNCNFAAGLQFCSAPFFSSFLTQKPVYTHTLTVPKFLILDIRSMKLSTMNAILFNSIYHGIFSKLYMRFFLSFPGLWYFAKYRIEMAYFNIYSPSISLFCWHSSAATNLMQRHSSSFYSYENEQKLKMDDKLYTNICMHI